jgi:RNA polymerase sigma-70 factor (family 1)
MSFNPNTLTAAEFKVYFDQHFDAIRSYIYYRSGDGELATDVAQDSFLRLWEKRDKLKQTQIKSLLYKIAGACFIDKIRKEKSSEKHLQQFNFELTTAGPEADFAYTELKEQYQKALALLSDKQRTVFLMNRMDDLSYKEIALRMNVSVKAIEKLMSKALVGLKNNIPNYDPTLLR